MLYNGDLRHRNACGKRTIPIPPNSQSTQEFVSQTFALCDCRQAAMLYLLSIQFKGIIWEFETLLNKRGEFSNPSSLLSKDFLGVRSTDNDLRHSIIRNSRESDGNVPQCEHE
jgi:uncharacterized membrane-anchored protein